MVVLVVPITKHVNFWGFATLRQYAKRDFYSGREL